MTIQEAKIISKIKGLPINRIYMLLKTYQNKYKIQ